MNENKAWSNEKKKLASCREKWVILIPVLMALKAESGSCQNITDNLHFCVWVPEIIVAQCDYSR